ncbi:hypothetical protein PHLGIDRAFT_121989 [Phlebiopsis gigantea 11061_1 CR5-6]|uniref:SWIM-type domain-containing protein n=1 Tax=Phlebiopsis gigantea (strain 11061_1 CR5-6) TaxID=745531 RepID=A0A0C3RRY7_PHLG1|nr:hypothetical protein PHLGIDRAFT_121989 [Phlebiopsis gigantea 11061_1 CR5-6]
MAEILPAIFQQRSVEKADRIRFEAQILSLPGGRELLEHHKLARSQPSPLPVAYLAGPDDLRDERARSLIENKQLGVPTPSFTSNILSFVFPCYSALSTPHDKSPVTYEIILGYQGNSSCSCPDFQNRGGACKHIRAALMRLEELQKLVSTDLPSLVLPKSEQDARQLAANLVLQTGSIPRAVEEVQRLLAELPLERAANVVEETLSNGLAVTQNTDEGVNSDDEDSGSDGGVGAVSDADSIATDAPFDPSLDSPFDFTALRTSSKTALSEQSTSQALCELESVAPKLGLLSKFLTTAELKNPADFSRARAIKAHIDSLSHELARLLVLGSLDATDVHAGVSTQALLTTGNDTQVTPKTPPVRPSTPPLYSYTSKRRQSQLLDASPEKSQKRKPSYGIYWYAILLFNLGLH